MISNKGAGTQIENGKEECNEKGKNEDLDNAFNDEENPKAEETNK